MYIRILCLSLACIASAVAMTAQEATEAIKQIERMEATVQRLTAQIKAERAALGPEAAKLNAKALVAIDTSRIKVDEIEDATDLALADYYNRVIMSWAKEVKGRGKNWCLNGSWYRTLIQDPRFVKIHRTYKPGDLPGWFPLIVK